MWGLFCLLDHLLPSFPLWSHFSVQPPYTPDHPHTHTHTHTHTPPSLSHTHTPLSLSHTHAHTHTFSGIQYVVSICVQQDASDLSVAMIGGETFRDETMSAFLATTQPAQRRHSAPAVRLN